MIEGVDYSYAHPTPSGLRAAGKKFAVRYVGVSTPAKSLTRGEVDELRAVGIDVVAVYQTTANFMLTADGATGARRAHQHAVACGMPPSRPIYFALDTNPNTITPSGWAGVERYLNAAAGVLGRERVGVYAGYAGIERLCPRVARWGWQTYAWSAGRWSARAQLQQYRNGQSLAGGTVDLCRSPVADYGQWGVVAPVEEEEEQVTPEQMKELKDHLDNRLVRVISWLTTGKGNTYVNPDQDATVEAWDFADDVETISLNEIMGAVRDDIGEQLDELDTAIGNISAGVVDVQALATTLAPLVGGWTEEDWERLRQVVDGELDKRSLGTPE